MNAKLKAIAAETIKNEVPYMDGKKAAADMFIEVCKKTDKRWTERKEINFLIACGLRSK